MKFMAVTEYQGEDLEEVAGRFLGDERTAPEGVKLLGRWHSAAARGGFTLFEADDAANLADWAYQWADLVELEIYPVVGDDEVAALFSRVVEGDEA